MLSIRFWLPSFLEYEYIALRFLPQEFYSGAAPMDISPTPDVVTRVFMLFQRVSADSISTWPIALEKARRGVDWWRDVVGVNIDRTVDLTLFRVLEWGGAELPC